MLDLEQSERIEFEDALVRKFFPEFALQYDMKGNPYFVGWTGKNGRRNNYKLRLKLSSSFPDFEPELLVERPRTLRMFKDLRTINSLGCSHKYHVNGKGDKGGVKICFTDDWDASCTCVMALLRGILWVDGYEHHLRTGETIDAYLSQVEEQVGA